MRGDPEAIKVNGCEVTVTREDTREQLYKNTFITAFEVLETSVEAIAQEGRTRWKVENENNNLLKTKGYPLKHNFGHGSQYLSCLLLRLIRQALRTRQKFLQPIETLLCYLLFPSWDELFSWMCKGLELDTG